MTFKTLSASCFALLALAAPASAADEQLVRFAAGTPDATERSIVEAAGGRVTRDLDLIGGVGAELAAGAAHRLAAHPRVTEVSANHAVRMSGAIDPYNLDSAFNESLRTEKVWNANHDAATGKGVAVAVLDTGIAGDLVDFQVSQHAPTSRVIASVVTNPDATTATDTFGHGTHVAGLIAGNGFNRHGDDRLYGKYAGTAPDADLVSVKVADDRGNSTLLDVIAGLQFVVDHKDTYGIRVANLSLNSATAQSYLTDPLDAAVEQAWMQGIVVVTAAGNRGEAPDATHYAPANDPYVITVGGGDDMGTKNISDDALAPWSSRGRTQDGLRKPDVIAPGARMVSALAPGSVFATICPTCVVGDGQYLRIGGTSMSAAVTSGVVADLLEVHPEWTPDEVKAALMSTARMVGGMGREVDAYAAMRVDPATLRNPNAKLKPSTLIDAATGTIDYSRASWSRASWSDAADMLRASWSRASWSCDCAESMEAAVDPSRASWSRASWSRASWSFSPTL